MKSLYEYQAVFFDVGGTLLKVTPSVGAVYAKYARSFGYEGPVEPLNDQFRKEWKRMGGIESLGSNSGDAAEREFWSVLVRKVFDEFGGVKNFDEYFEIIFEAFKKKDYWHIFDDVLASNILPDLKARGVALGVISNWDSRLTATLENVGLASYFDFILPSAVVGSAKPDSMIFAEALRLSGAAPENACHIGDEVRTDVEGARRAGLASILIDRNNRFSDGYDRKITSFLELQS
ncbi:MAG: HAD-IA family hydrolase [Candidatus Nitrohelix vancouverensis]|uniref:HAD-IA family hydrolase n=1 Tax=Candidatus Nitrohelix vancouverensis TaxID=2705534 RepID=A0A7T0BZX3_9BACT|nr:MAG: HAD-IA family hydrolase [Candidatus Nitrohelix vancouverensis]